MSVIALGNPGHSAMSGAGRSRGITTTRGSHKGPSTRIGSRSVRSPTARLAPLIPIQARTKMSIGLQAHPNRVR